jgi:hypothetical protein
MAEQLIDPVLEQAIRQAVQEANQPETTAKRLLKWMEAIASRDLSAEEQYGFLENVKDSILVEEN